MKGCEVAVVTTCQSAWVLFLHKKETKAQNEPCDVLLNTVLRRRTRVCRPLLVDRENAGRGQSEVLVSCVWFYMFGSVNVWVKQLTSHARSLDFYCLDEEKLFLPPVWRWMNSPARQAGGGRVAPQLQQSSSYTEWRRRSWGAGLVGKNRVT